MQEWGALPRVQRIKLLNIDVEDSPELDTWLWGEGAGVTLITHIQKAMQSQKISVQFHSYNDPKPSWMNKHTTEGASAISSIFTELQSN